MPELPSDSSPLPLLPPEACTTGSEARGPGRLFALHPGAEAPPVLDRPRVLDANLANSVPEHLVQRYRCLPLVLKGNALVLGMVDPFNILAIDDFRLITGWDVEPVTLPEEAFRSAYYHGQCEGIFVALEDQGRHDILEALYEAARKGLRPRPPTDRERVDFASPFPLRGIGVEARVSGPVASVKVTQRFANPRETPIEAIYIFPLPEGAAVHAFRMRVGHRVVEGTIRERRAARATYEEGVAQGHRAALIEQDRDNVFTVLVGNLPAGEEVAIELEYAERLDCNESETVFRFPLVVAPRYIPGAPLEGPGIASDTRRVPDASTITPPLLLPDLVPGATLDLVVHLETAGLQPGLLACSQHAISQARDHGNRVIRLAREDEILDRDFILRFRLGDAQPLATLLTFDDSPGAGTFLLSVLPPLGAGAASSGVVKRDASSVAPVLPAEPGEDDPASGLPRDVIFLLDRSGSMGGPKMESARRATRCFLETLRTSDRFAVVAFDDRVEVFEGPEPGTSDGPEGLRLHPSALCDAAIQWLDGIDARGGTEILRPIRHVLATPATEGRLLCAMIVTDGEVGNEPEIYRIVSKSAAPARLFTLGIDTAVNSAFLRELARIGRGSCELVTPGEALVGALDRLARETQASVVTDLSLVDRGMGIVDGTMAPDPLPDLFAARPLHVMGRKTGSGGVEVRGSLRVGGRWVTTVMPVASGNRSLGVLWARARVGVLEDRIRLLPTDREKLEREIVDLALRYSLLTRLTSFVLVDRAEVVNPVGDPQAVVQPVALPAQWNAEAFTPFGGFGVHELCELTESVGDISATDLGPLEVEEAEDEEVALDKLRELVDEAPIIRVVNLIICQAINDRATHVHIEPAKKGVTVYYRVDGTLHEVMSPPLHVHRAMMARLKLMAGLDLSDRCSLARGCIHLRHDSREYNLSLAFCPTQHGERVVMEIAGASDGPPPVLGHVFPVAAVQAAVEGIVQSQGGIVLVAGSRRSNIGRTLQGLAGCCRSGLRSVVAWDDRVDYGATGAVVLERGMGALQGSAETRLAAATAGTSDLELVEVMFGQDPDAVFLGPVKSAEIAQFVTRESFRPCLVVMRCEAPDAATALSGWVRQVGDAGLVADSLVGVLAQRSLRALCTRCRERYRPSPDVAGLYGLAPEAASLHRAVGCDRCCVEGYSGTVDAISVVPVDDGLREVIERNPPRRELRDAVARATSCSLLDAARRLVLGGETSHEECIRVLCDMDPAWKTRASTEVGGP